MPKRWYPYPRSLTTQVLLLALTGLLLVQLLGIQIYSQERNEALSLVNSRNAMIRLSSVVRLLNGATAPLQEEILRASRSETLMMRLQPVPLLPSERDTQYELLLRRQLDYPPQLTIQISVEQADDRLPPPDLTRHPHFAQGRGRLFGRNVRLFGAIQLANGQWLNFSSLADKEPPAWSLRTILSLLLVAALVGLLVSWLLGRTTRPLKQLARQAEHFSRGEDIPPLPETGPLEIRETLIAFNRMQQRLNRFVQDRTQMLAAISHDLRTPLTSLRLRSEFLPDSEDKERMQQTLQQMEAMLNATLSFARDDHHGEPSRNVDLVSLLNSLCDDYVDTGHRVVCQAEGKLVYACRPAMLRRVVQNLIGNAVKYAGNAEVSLNSDDQYIYLTVQDSGPGIPPEQLESVFKPFFRLDTARNTEDGSVGLGLSIARTLIHQHGGEISLENRPEGGLRVRVSLPR